MTDKVRWGILSTARIGVDKVIPAMQRGEWCDIVAIASRKPDTARKAARSLGIPRAYGSYEELLADDQVEAIYNPLPNHLHLPWTIKAAEAGKHVLCEKPITLNLDEATTLLAVRDRTGVKIQEAFMVHTHPQWLRVRELINSGRIGELCAISGFFSYFNRDPLNIRNQADIGGGALMDIGCYPITMSRFTCNDEPRRVLALIEHDPELKIDRLTTGILDFPRVQSTFTCGTQLVAYQRMQFFGARGRIDVEIPFNAPANRAARIFVDDGSSFFGEGIETSEFPMIDQYTVQGDLFSRAIRQHLPQPIPLENSARNMAVIEALFRSAESGGWEVP